MVRLNWGNPQPPTRAPRAWGARSKWLLNVFSHRLFGTKPFKVPAKDFYVVPDWQKKVEGGWRSLVRETNLPAAIALLALCITITTVWKTEFPKFLPDLWLAMGGMVFEVLFILVIFALFEHRRADAQEIQRQREIIADYKTWDSREAQQRMAGAIRRLNRRDIFAIDFTGAEISKFVCAQSDSETDRVYLLRWILG
jgi:hypothetical protein